MTTETRQRIRAYKRMLPDLRERVIAVALLLAMSASMLGSASYAWLTISRRPEVTGVNTSVAANGNLEIALATSDKVPNDSQVGDSIATEGQSVTAANITWGNLVNLSDESYGLQGLALRPARLNEDALLSNPLFGAEYTADGRVEKLNSGFRYTSWMENEFGDKYFGISKNLGVRAVSSTKLTATSGPVLRYLEMQSNALGANSNAVGAFEKILANADWMDLLAVVMGYHMCAYLESSNADYNDKAVTYTQLNELTKMYAAFIDAFAIEAGAMAELMNFQLYALTGGDENKYTAYTTSTILSSISSPRKNGTRSLEVSAGAGKAVIPQIETFLYDYNMLCADYEVLQTKLEQQKETYRWTTDGLKTIIGNLVNINTCLIDFHDGKGAQTVTSFLSSLTSNIMGASSYLNAQCTATITNGVMYDFCRFTGAEMSVTRQNSNGKKGLPITAGMYITTANIGHMETTVYATIITNAPKPGIYTDTWNSANEIKFAIDESQMTMQAEDTYALAIDLWVRTNAENSYLTLEGNVLTQSHEEPVMGRNASASPVPLYTLTRITEATDPETNETVQVPTLYELYPGSYYQSEETGYYHATQDNTKWYRADNFTEFKLESGETPNQKWQTITEVIGYEGENRIWDREDNKNLTVDSTSQGSGSCYVYYADTPEDMARSLELLKAMHVAFIDVDGNLLANSVMDTDSRYEESGRVIVPLKLDSDSETIGTGEDTVSVITLLQKNVPTRITALVYLDGTMLTNENVLSAAEIQGQLNIQFGSSSDMSPISNEALEVAERSVSATVSKSAFNYDTDTDLTTTVSVAVAGEQPSAVTAFFIRKINESQGSREPVMTQFEWNEATATWDCNYTFSAPGTYILRTVELDGQEYVLKTTPQVEVEGFTITNLTFSGQNLNVDGRSFTIKTADSSASVNLALQFASSDMDKMPQTVQGRFLREDGTAVNVNFSYNANNGTWTGTANFLTSGEYTMEFVVLDGGYRPLPAGLSIAANISLGMKVAVYNNLESKLIKFDLEKMTDDQKLLKMYVKIMDGSGNEIIGLTDAKLTYKLDGSAVETMDTNLIWDPTAKLYYGELKVYEAADPSAGTEEFSAALGTWLFGNVKVGSNTLTNAIAAPEFRLSDPASPEFVRVSTNMNDQFVPTGIGAKMSAFIKYSAGATTMARIQHTPATGPAVDYYIIGRIGDTSEKVTEWFFDLPLKMGATVDGYWTMEEIYVWNYVDEMENAIVASLKKGESDWNYSATDYYADASQITVDGSYMHFTDVIADSNYKIKVIQTPRVDFQSVNTVAPPFEGSFLQTHTIGLTDSADTRVKVKITDFEGEAILVDASKMKLTYNYDGNSKEYGFYESTAIQPGESFTLTFEQDASDDTLYIQKDNQQIQYAGNYTPARFTYTVGETGNQKNYSYGGANEASLPGGIPGFQVTSSKPTVTITGISPTPGTVKRVYTVKTPAATAQAVQGDFFRFSESSATVYIHTPLAGNFDQEAAEAYAPTVTLQLSDDVPSGYSDATMLFTTKNADSNNSEFKFSNGTATAEVGKAVTGVRGWFGVDDYPECYPAGRMTQDKLSITYGNITYQVTVSNTITIDQPQAPTVLIFGGIPENYTGTKPEQVQGVGTTVTVTLPTLEWTARIEKPKTANWSAYSAVGEVTDASGNALGRMYSVKHWTTSGACGSTNDNYQYQYYIWTQFQSSITAETDIYTQDKKIDKWVINGKTYNAGQQITVTGDGILTATAVVTDLTGEIFSETLEQTTYKNLYGYVKEAETRSSLNGGEALGNTLEGQNATHYTVKIAEPTTADAATDKVGTNMTTDSSQYTLFK